MREILFRGKTKDGDWVEGFLFNSQLCRIFWATAFKEEEDNIFYCEGKDVNPETVGQFTGLIDLNGKKIFEGDIVKISAIADIEESLGQVVVNNGAYCVFIPTNQNPKNQPLLYWLGSSRIEVIGNIHDNPKLLE